MYSNLISTPLNFTEQRTKPFSSLNVFSCFEDGISKEKLKKIELRKDAIMLLNLKQKYDTISKNSYKPIKRRNIAFFKLKDGRNLFDVHKKYLNLISDIYELKFKEVEEVDLDHLSLLPNLAKLYANFTYINYPQIFTNEQKFFPSLQSLDLTCNNLDTRVLNYLKNMKSLKYLNLMGNLITSTLPDLENCFTELEELNLSYNKIESFFINIPQIKDSEKALTQIKMSKNNLNINMITNPTNQTNQTILPPIPKINNSNFTEDAGLIQELENNTPHIDRIEPVINNLELAKDTFDEWHKYLKTNLQDFYHKISQLKNLKILNISNNKIHFFDIDPFYIQKQEGFKSLSSLDISSNLISEEISILLVMNIPNLMNLDISNNPICSNQTAFENIEFEIFKNKEILLINSKKNTRKLRMKKDPNKMIEEGYKLYKVKQYKVQPSFIFEKKVKERVNELANHRKQIEQDMQKDPELFVDLLESDHIEFHGTGGGEINSGKQTLEVLRDGVVENQYNQYIGENQENQYDLAEEDEEVDVLAEYRKKKSNDLFITNAPQVYNPDQSEVRLNFSKRSYNSTGTYLEFLKMAKECFGKEKHYKQSISISQAYQKLRFLVTNLQTEVKDNTEANYMKPTISNSIHLNKYVPDVENYKNGKYIFILNNNLY
jgi:Leucine-rich repeat (LRR) protein